MNHVGLFSGILGFEEAFRRAGATLLAVCEKDATCQRVIHRHRPDVEVFSDVKEIKRATFAGRSIDLLTGGFPCQDLSVAGRRAGLAGERSGLWFEFLRIIGDHLPRWVVIENVPGLLSSNGGRDFAVILRGLVELGYGVAWRVLDAQYFGLAQRRQRVFIVGSLRSGRAAEVLFESEGGGWNPAPRREAGQRVAGAATTGIATGSQGEIQSSYKKRGGFGWSETKGIAGTLESEGGTHQGGPERVPLIAATLNSGGNSGGFRTEPGEHLITCFRDERGRGSGCHAIENVAYPLHCAKGQSEQQIIAFTERTRSEGRTVETQEELAYALTNPGAGGRAQERNIAGGFGVRRLMPVECERLQGFPDGWTATGDDGKPISDSARYRMLGNAVAVPVVEWIARRIMAMEAAC